MKHAALLLQDSMSPVYQCAEAKGAKCTLINIVNTHTSTVYLNIALRIGETEFPLLPLDFQLDTGAKLEDDTVYFVPFGAFIMAKASTANVAKAILQLEPQS